MVRHKLLKLGAGIIIVLIVGFGFSLWQFSSSKSQAALAGESFMQAVSTKDVDGSYDLLAPSLKRQFAEKAAWQQWITLTFGDKLQAHKLAQESPLSEELRGNAYKAEDAVMLLVYELRYDDKTYNLPLVLSPDNAGKWLIDDIGRFEAS